MLADISADLWTLTNQVLALKNWIQIKIKRARIANAGDILGGNILQAKEIKNYDE